MPTTLNAWTAGESGDAGTYRKKRDSSGRTYYVKDGEGRISQESYAGAKRHLNRFVTDGDGLPKQIAEADTTEKLEQLTGIPFDSQEGFLPIRGDADDLAEKKRAEGNRYLGFYEARSDKYDSPDDPEAARDYIEFRNELKEAYGQEETAIVRKKYGLEGS